MVGLRGLAVRVPNQYDGDELIDASPITTGRNSAVALRSKLDRLHSDACQQPKTDRQTRRRSWIDAAAATRHGCAASTSARVGKTDSQRMASRNDALDDFMQPPPLPATDVITLDGGRWRALSKASLTTLSKRIHESTPCSLQPVQQQLHAAYGGARDGPFVAPRSPTPLFLSTGQLVDVTARLVPRPEASRKLAQAVSEGDALDGFLASAKHALQVHHERTAVLTHGSSKQNQKHEG